MEARSLCVEPPPVWSRHPSRPRDQVIPELDLGEHLGNYMGFRVYSQGQGYMGGFPKN